MKNALTELLDLSEMKREKLGIRYTASEIAGQVDIWEISATKLFENADQLRLLLHSLRDARGGCVVCTGAGTSEFIGYCIEGLLRKRLGLPVNVFSTTRIVTTPWEIFFGGAKPLLLSFARSGNSPESVGAVQIAEMMGTDLNHLVVTCNREGGGVRPRFQQGGFSWQRYQLGNCGGISPETPRAHFRAGYVRLRYVPRSQTRS